ncbi:MAG: Sulfurtransferase [Pedosphaera sp.]|nr:Sulfurtransferase [Pedosphaera sp.]
MTTKLRIPDPVKAREFFENKVTFTTGPVELDRMLKAHEDINVIDVRAEEDYRKGHIPGAINLPHEKWDALEGLSKDKPNVLYCYSMVCHLAATAAYLFASKGYPVMELDGGFDEWKEHDLETERTVTNRLFGLGR